MRRENESRLSLTIWLAAQVGALAAAGFRVRVWATAPKSEEILGAAVMVTTQLAVVSLIFSILLRNARSLGIVLLTAWPMALLAAVLAEVTASRIVAAESLVSLWICGLFLLRRGFAGGFRDGWIAALATAITLGGPLAWYLRVEFGDANAGRPQVYGPIMGAIALLQASDYLPWTAYASAALAVMIGAVAVFIRSARDARKKDLQI